MKVFIVGATGVLGRNAIPRFLERGHEVRAIARKAEQVEALRRLGVEAFQGDILDAESLIHPAQGCDAALHLATAIPKRGQEWDLSRDAQIRRDGTQNLLYAAIQVNVRRYIQQSITFIYGNRGTELTDETSPVSPNFNSAAFAMEEQVKESPLDWTILRGGWFYGPVSGQEAGWREDARAQTLLLPADGDALVSLIHETDMAQAVVLATESAPAHSIYNVVDDQPVSYRELYGHVAALVDAPAPASGGPVHLPPLGCSNARLKSELDWRPAYSTYRSGLI